MSQQEDPELKKEFKELSEENSKYIGSEEDSIKPKEEITQVLQKLVLFESKISQTKPGEGSGSSDTPTNDSSQNNSSEEEVIDPTKQIDN